MKSRAGFKVSMVFTALAALTLGSTASMAAGVGGGGGHFAGGGGGHAMGGGGHAAAGRGYGYGGYHGGYGYRGGYGYHGGYGYRGYYGGWGGWGLGLGVGLYFGALPLYYSTLWWGGVPYYYADNTYYVYDGSVGQYETVAPPAGLVNQVAAQQPIATDLIAYPKNGQTAEQQSKDKFECHQWAVAQSGFDPSQGASPSVTPSQRSDYTRAQAACLEGRGYSVK